MTAARVQSAIAAGLSDPSLLKGWSSAPERLHDCGIADGALDLDAIRKFAGLGCKVRHNELRGALPLSFRLLNKAGIEIDFFAAYAEEVASSGIGLAKTKEERADCLIDFAGQWVDLALLEHALFWDVLRHEMAIYVVKSKPSKARTMHPMPDGLHGHSIARLQGDLLLRDLKSNPVDVTAILQNQNPAWSDLSMDGCLMGYWRAGGSQSVHVMELDALSFETLRHLDGRRSLDDIANILLGAAASSVFLSSIQELASLDLNADGASMIFEI